MMVDSEVGQNMCEADFPVCLDQLEVGARGCTPTTKKSQVTPTSGGQDLT